MNRLRAGLSVNKTALTPASKTISRETVKICELCGTLNYVDNAECWTCRWHGGFDHTEALVGLAWLRLESQYEEVRLEHVTSQKMRALGDFGSPRSRSLWKNFLDDCRARWSHFQAQRDLRMSQRRAALRSNPSSKSNQLGV